MNCRDGKNLDVGFCSGRRNFVIFSLFDLTNDKKMALAEILRDLLKSRNFSPLIMKGIVGFSNEETENKFQK